ncbi:hypothetical protein B0I32_105409 [Nonomuraea fuscirosea]|uniref:Uncharacterized protein n=1 Tax=Nonomuraea fuscirosea TaxID=1291556 RepID=A0A2T0N459_9ACTN|nr:hypothetical protein [Nonomuraea fuscirosea]PRX66969.1 hypothetical protein B0I32_105409 [Nonomuraea fuscirosea]
MTATGTATLPRRPVLAETDLATCEVLRPERCELRADVPTGHVSTPAGPGFVSLRAVATGTEGTGVTQTITRAYAVG